MYSKYKLLVRFFQGFCSFAAILPSFYTSYPYINKDNILADDWQKIANDLYDAISKYEKMEK